MRVVFMGTPSFAVPSLRALATAHEVAGVYTRPDAASGRGSQLRPSPVKRAAVELGLAVFQPRTLRDPEAQAELRSLAPDVVVVAAYGLILPPEVLEIPRFGCINVHASLLPKWRGAAPVQRAILAGDAVTGVAIMRMEAGLDTGPFCATGETAVDAKSADDLTAELADLGAALLIEMLPSIADGTCAWHDQDEAGVTYAEKIAKSDVALDPELTAQEALRRLRASSAQAPARARIADKAVTVLAAGHGTDAVVAPGTALQTKTGVVLGFSDGSVEVTRIKPEGKGEMDAAAWARGARLGESSTWGAL